ncbi:LysR family transcriptional regulator [Burkholderia cenocepacia]|uniref:LysR family transcriptional regulator n=1 Tax=Burkholderia cenocepacia TaxID=95486 RepID=UPI001908E89C|nr:LysR family transcriptional regulator [Burkholderia cenocepacia]MBJ9894879.1 LysR family transcriptional regulator [Burkholderia cenocepacia]
MDLDSIRIFLRVVERGSFTAASVELDMPLSRVSRKVKHLEDDLGVQLLYRTTRRVSVTEAGRDYYDRCLRAEDILLAADRQVRTLRTDPEGTLRVLVPYAIGLFQLEPALAEFRRRYPLVQLVLIYDNSPLDLVEHGFDVALRAGLLNDSGYVARSLGWSHAKLAASPAYLDRTGRPRTPDDLAQHDILFVGRDAPGLTLRLSNTDGERADVPVQPVLISNESVTVLRQATSGGGIALISTHFTARRLARNELEIVLPDWHRTNDVELHALYPRRATLDSMVRAFVEFLTELFATWQTAP